MPLIINFYSTDCVFGFGSASVSSSVNNVRSSYLTEFNPGDETGVFSVFEHHRVIARLRA